MRQMGQIPNEPTIDLSDYEWNIQLRKLTVDDFDAVVEMQQRCFPGMQPWKREQFESQVNTFPDGQFCLEY